MADPFIGEIRMFAGNFAPQGWAFCSGQLLAISENTALFSLLGTTYGGDGQQTFGLPNLQGRIPMHMGTGPGLSPRTIGQLGGAESVTLIQNQIPSHTHVPQCSATAGNQASPTNGFWAPAGTGVKLYSNVAPAVALNAAAVGSAGGNQPHENRPPFLVVNFIISLFGIYPSQN